MKCLFIVASIIIAAQGGTLTVDVYVSVYISAVTAQRLHNENHLKWVFEDTYHEVWSIREERQPERELSVSVQTLNNVPYSAKCSRGLIFADLVG